MLKRISIVLLFLMFFTFLFYQTQKSADFIVLEVVSPVQIIVDLNDNGIKEEGETITLQNIKSFSPKPSGAQAALARRLKITEEDALGLGFLAQSFAEKTLSGKKVKIKDRQIFVENKNYKDLLVKRGFTSSSQFAENLKKVQKLNLIIFNNKSHKYHRLNCKYGLLAHNSQILPANQIPKDAMPCKFCHNEKQKAKGVNGKKQYNDNIYLISYVKPPAMEFEQENIKIFLTDFTQTLKPDNRCETPVCKSLVGKINSSQTSIDFAIYGYTKVPAIEKALENAQRRGIKVRFVYDTDGSNNNIYPDTFYLTKIITNSSTDHLPPIMHDKFFIFDNSSVLTGSANISNTDMSGFNSNAILLIDSPQIAQIYRQEFDSMYSGRFHKAKPKINDKEIGDLGIYFSPKDKTITTQIIPLINGAQKYIYIPSFLITHKGLTDSLVAASKREVVVKIILDATNTHTSSSKMKALRGAGIQVKTENLAGKLHSKSIIIDDLYTVIGSMNFSRSGEGINDENLVIIKNPQIAQFYKNFFIYLWKRIPDYWLTHNARAESPDSLGSCSDNIDNDFDGKIDKADDSCKQINVKKY